MKKLIFSVSIFLCLSAFAQDPHFTQFWAKPLELNPSMAGSLEGKFRLAVLHRNQWRSIMQGNSFKSYVGSFDMRFNGGFAEEDSWGVGINFLNDKGGFQKTGATQIGGTFAYHKFLGDIGWEGHHQISLGFRGEYSDRSVNFGDITFNNMWDSNTGGYDGALTENLPKERKTFMDFGTGLLYEFYIDNRTNFYGGLAIHHLTQPNVSFSGVEHKLNMRMVFHGGARLPLADLFDVQPRIIVMKQGKWFEMMYGANLRFVIGDYEKETALYAGAHHRLVNNVTKFGSEALGFNAGVEFANCQIGFAYDVNVSDLNKASDGRGGYELFLIFTGGELSKGNVRCPKF